MENFQAVHRNGNDWDIYFGKERVFKIREWDYIVVIGCAEITKGINWKFTLIGDAICETFEWGAK